MYFKKKKTKTTKPNYFHFSSKINWELTPSVFEICVWNCINWIFTLPHCLESLFSVLEKSLYPNGPLLSRHANTHSLHYMYPIVL